MTDFSVSRFPLESGSQLCFGNLRHNFFSRFLQVPLVRSLCYAILARSIVRNLPGQAQFVGKLFLKNEVESYEHRPQGKRYAKSNWKVLPEYLGPI